MKSLEKVFRIIELLEKTQEIKLQDIANELSMYKSTVHRIVSELCEYNYLERHEETKKYKLGLKFVDISSHVIDNMDIRELAKKSIEELNVITKETIHLAMFIDNQAVYIDKKESTHAIRMYSKIGKVAPLYCTGVGKAIVAFQTPEIVQQLLDSITFHKYTEHTIESREQFLKEIEEIRKNGYAVDRGEHEENVACIAAPIRDYSKKVIASLSITAILYRMKMEELLAYKYLLVEKAQDISRSLGYRESP